MDFEEVYLTEPVGHRGAEKAEGRDRALAAVEGPSVRWRPIAELASRAV